jgi:tetratricopeptide (TPR) repeat protein
MKTKKPQTKQQIKKSIDAGTTSLLENNKTTVLALMIAFCLPVFLYLQTLAFGCIYFDDDLIILNNISFLSDLRNVPQAFMKDAFIANSHFFYRPLQTVSYMADICLSGGNNPWMYHLTNVVVLGFIACLLYLLFGRFIMKSSLALCGALVYCVHPLFVSSIAWIPARGDLLLTGASVLSFILFIEFLETEKKLYLFLHWAAFTLALFCKETAAFLPFLFSIYYLIFYYKTTIKIKHLIAIMLYGASGTLWYFLRSRAIPGDVIHNDVYGLKALIDNLRVLPESLAKFMVPLDMAPLPGYSAFKTFTGIGVIIVLILLFFYDRERLRKEKIFSISWFLILMLPAMLYKHHSYDYLDHRFFLPFIGILAFIMFILPRKWHEKGSAHKYWITIAVLLFLSGLSFIKSYAYADSMTFYNTAILRNDTSDFAYNNRGANYLSQGMFDKAIADFTKAIEIKPYYKAYYNRGIAFDAMGLYDNAIADYTIALELKSDDGEILNNRGITYFHRGLYNNAIADYTMALKIGPDDADVYYNRGMAYQRLELYDKATDDYSKAIELKADYAEVYNNRGTNFMAQGLMDKGLSDFTRAIDLKPDFAEAYFNRGILYLHQGNTDQSCRDFRKAEKNGYENVKDTLVKYCKNNAED